LRLSFRGKRGIHHDVSLDDRRVVRIVRRCKQLPGQELFQYEENGEIHRIGSGDVNDYLSGVAGERFTAKDFRTWHGTVQALELTRLACSAGNYSAMAVLREVAGQLGNTVAVCRKSYIHPAVLELGKALGSRSEALADDAAAELWAGLEGPPSANGLRAAERRLLAFLRTATPVSAPDRASPASR
jgi:DNA topoisomerase-1